MENTPTSPRRFLNPQLAFRALLILSISISGCSSRVEELVEKAKKDPRSHHEGDFVASVDKWDDVFAQWAFPLRAHRFPSENLAQELAEIPSQTPYKIVVDKSWYGLYVFKDGEMIKSFPITYGYNTEQAKSQKGDLATPEGIYFISYVKPDSRYQRFLGLSYPNPHDAAKGLENNLITQRQHDLIVRRHSNWQHPLFRTALGTGIGFHGKSHDARWTHGCVSMDNDLIEWLYQHVGVGTGVKIRQ